MRYGYDLEYAGVRAESLGIYVVRRPDIPAPEYDMEAIVIPGRDGVLHKDNHRYHPIEITIEFNYLEKPEAWAENGGMSSGGCPPGMHDCACRMTRTIFITCMRYAWRPMPGLRGSWERSVRSFPVIRTSI